MVPPAQYITTRDMRTGAWETSTLFDHTVNVLTQQGMQLDDAVSITLEALWLTEKEN